LEEGKNKMKDLFGRTSATMLLILAVACITGFSQLNEKEDQTTNNGAAVRAKYLAFFGTTSSDWAVITPATASTNIIWKIIKNPSFPPPAASQIRIFPWGVQGDTVEPGSFTGDATFDPTVYRPSTFEHWIGPWETNGTPFLIAKFGAAGDNAARNGDYDGDGIDDITQVRIIGSQLIWHVRPSTAPTTTRIVPFGGFPTGTNVFAFQGADFTGDGRDEFVIAYVTTATGRVQWVIGDSITGNLVWAVNWGNFQTDFMINPADYTGDHRADIVVWAAGRSGLDGAKWFILNGATGLEAANSGQRWGLGDPSFTNNDLPVRGDYDGDGIHDLTVWRPSTGTFYSQASSNGNMMVQQWGDSNDIPLGNFFTF
jgi:hypothetical protein